MSDININNTDELEALRAQMQELKATLDRHELFNEKLLRRKIATSNAGRSYKYFNFILVPFIAAALLFLKENISISWLFYWCTLIFTTASVAFDTYINRITRKEYTTMALLELASALERRRRLRRLHLALGMPLVIPWMIWYCYELSDNVPYSWIYIIIGGFIGGSIGIYMMRRMQKKDATAIDDIHQFLDDRQDV